MSGVKYSNLHGLRHFVIRAANRQLDDAVLCDDLQPFAPPSPLLPYERTQHLRHDSPAGCGLLTCGLRTAGFSTADVSFSVTDDTDGTHPLPLDVTANDGMPMQTYRQYIRPRSCRQRDILD